jgi:DNA-binding transcriptional regulator of glucitol operon
MAVTAGRARPHWAMLLRPRWLAWHAFAVLATAGMLYLGDWQLHRAESGNELSWAYTFEWPLFAIFCVYFWVKSLRDELRGQAAGTAGMTGDPAESAAAPVAPAAADAYVERLRSEVRGHGKWHGWR